MRAVRISSLVTALAAGLIGAPPADASAGSFCTQIGGQWDGQYCRATVVSERNAVRQIGIAVPAEIDEPLMAATLRDYLSTLMDNWRSVARQMAADSWGDAHLQTYQHGSLLTLVFHETYHSDGTALNDAYRTFTFDRASGRRVQLADLLAPGTSLASIATLGASFIATALDEAQPPHEPGSYPFVPERWMPDTVYSGGYKAWALSQDALLLYLPDYPVARDTPVDYTPAHYLWSMNGGTVQPRIPLDVLSPILRPGLI